MATILARLGRDLGLSDPLHPARLLERIRVSAVCVLRAILPLLRMSLSTSTKIDPAVKEKIEELARTSAALDVLVDALARCRVEDMRTTKTFAALDFLEARATAKWAIRAVSPSLGRCQRRRPVAKSQRIAQWHQAGGELSGVMITTSRSWCPIVERTRIPPMNSSCERRENFDGALG